MSACWTTAYTLTMICQISSKSVERYGDLTVFKMAVVRHHKFVKFKYFNGLNGEETHFALAY